MTDDLQQSAFGPVVAEYDGYIVVLTDTEAAAQRQNASEAQVTASGDTISELVEAFERRDGLLLGGIDYHEREDRSVTLGWDDYDMMEEHIGGEVQVPADQVAALTEWLRSLKRPDVHEMHRERHAEHQELRKRIREDLYAGLPDRIDVDDGRELRLYARDDAGRGVYSTPHMPEDDPDRWLLRTPDGVLTPCGRPQAPDKHGRPRRYIFPRPTEGQQWTWVRYSPTG